MAETKTENESGQPEQLTPEQKWDRATLSNNFIFYKVMRAHPEACQRLLEMLLGIKIKEMKMSAEETIAVDHDAKGIRLDVFVKDTGKMFDVEMQMANTHELPERARYYQGVMDIDALKANQKYKDMRDSHVIFICLEDIFHNGLPVNTFENICIEDGKTKLRDRAWKHFFFAPLCATMIKDEEAKAFFEFLISNQASNSYTDKLKVYVADAKQSTENKMQFMTWERQRAYDFDAGKEAKAIEDAVMLIREYDEDPKVAAEKTGAPLDKVLEALAAQPAPAQA